MKTLKSILSRLAHGDASKRLGSTRHELLCELPKGAVGAEIGVHLGDFSREILRIARPRKLYLIDPWKYEGGNEYKEAWFGGAAGGTDEVEQRYETVKKRFDPQIKSGRVEILRADSAAALRSLPDASLDFVYIDGNHLYEFVKTDLELSLQKVRVGGLITGDDYGPGGWWDGGVKKAVDEFGWKPEVYLRWIHGNQFVLSRKQA